MSAAGPTPRATPNTIMLHVIPTDTYHSLVRFSFLFPLRASAVEDQVIALEQALLAFLSRILEG